VLIVAAIALTHPAMVPAAVVLIALAAVACPPRRARLAAALGALALAAALTAFWTWPLVLRLEHTRALAWGEPPGIGGLGWVLALLALLGLWRARAPGAPAARVLALFPWAMIAVTLLVRFVLEPLGVRFLPANRVADGAWIALILAAAVGWSGAGRSAPGVPPSGPVPTTAPRPRLPLREVLIGVAGVLLLVIVALRTGTLALWPRAADWPALAQVERGLRLGDLWAALRATPPGRVLFVRSAVPLVYGAPWGTAWYRPHTHVTALAPVFSGRAIVHGTFTHPSPIAALIYRGDAGPGPITRLAEQLDGHSLFGRPLESLDPRTLDRYADALGISAIVALDEDAPRLHAVDDSGAFERGAAPPPFRLHVRRDGIEVPRAVARDRWTVTVVAGDDGWASTRTAFYPLWRAAAQGAPLETRRGDLGDLEVRLVDSRGTRAVDLVYGPGAPEISGIAISLAGGVVWLAACRRRWIAA
jgi:hypothetical protein